jgi:hypothetical protein
VSDQVSHPYKSTGNTQYQRHENSYCCRGILWCIWGLQRKISQHTTPFSKSVCKIMPCGRVLNSCIKNLLMPSFGQAILLAQVADTYYRNGFLWFFSVPSTSH